MGLGPRKPLSSLARTALKRGGWHQPVAHKDRPITGCGHPITKGDRYAVNYNYNVSFCLECYTLLTTG